MASRWRIRDSRVNLEADQCITVNDGDDINVFGGVIWYRRGSRGSRGKWRVNNWDIFVDNGNVRLRKLQLNEVDHGRFSVLNTV